MGERARPLLNRAAGRATLFKKDADYGALGRAPEVANKTPDPFPFPERLA